MSSETIIDVEQSKRSECAKHKIGECGYCSDDEMIADYKAFLVAQGVDVSGSDIIKKVKDFLGVDKESKIFRHPKFVEWYGRQRAMATLMKVFKPIGPLDTTDLLSNINIDGAMHQWSEYSDSLFNRNFLHIPFHMIDFEKHDTELAKLSIKLMKDNDIDCFACVLNTDVSSGIGKHWFCIYGDLRHSGTSDDPVVIEFFNSSGNRPRPEVASWLDRITEEALADGIHVAHLTAVPTRLQYSRTECGVWCLAYILSRLNDIPPEIFHANSTDTKITAFRRHLFIR